MTTLSLREALIMFDEDLSEIRIALLNNASEIIKENTPYKELDDEEEMTVENIKLHFNHLYIEQQAKPLLNTVRRIDSYRIHKDAPQSAGFITDLDIQNAREVSADWFVYQASLSTRKPHKGMCPFHTDKTPSLTLMKSKQSGNLYLKCFPCSMSWDSIGYIMARDNLSFMEAVKVVIS